MRLCGKGEEGSQRSALSIWRLANSANYLVQYHSLREVEAGIYRLSSHITQPAANTPPTNKAKQYKP